MKQFAMANIHSYVKDGQPLYYTVYKHYTIYSGNLLTINCIQCLHHQMLVTKTHC